MNGESSYYRSSSHRQSKKGPGDIAFLWRSKARINERDTRILYSVLFAKLHSNLIKVETTYNTCLLSTQKNLFLVSQSNSTEQFIGRRHLVCIFALVRPVIKRDSTLFENYQRVSYTDFGRF